MFETQSSYKLQMECPQGRLGKKFPETRYCEKKNRAKNLELEKRESNKLEKKPLLISGIN